MQDNMFRTLLLLILVASVPLGRVSATSFPYEDDGRVCHYDSIRDVYVCVEYPCPCENGGYCIDRGSCVCPANYFGPVCDLSAYACAFLTCDGPSQMCVTTGSSGQSRCAPRDSINSPIRPVMLYVTVAIATGMSIASIIAIVDAGVRSALARIGIGSP